MMENKPDSEDVARVLQLIYLRTPPPLRPYEDGAACPWCGYCHEQITFGDNICAECQKAFLFGFPPWDDGPLISWVHLKYEEENMLISNPDLMPVFQPNERLKKLYEHYQVFGDYQKVTHNHETVQ